MRRTEVALLYKQTGNIRACQLLLGRRKLESTVRYFGVEIDDALRSPSSWISKPSAASIIWVRFAPCVDGSPLARMIFEFCDG